MNETPSTILIVIHPFGDYAKGQVITDPAAIAAVRSAGQWSRVIATVLPTDTVNSQGAR